MDFLYQIFTEGWKLWLVISILFFVAEGVNSGTFALFFGGAGAATTGLICFFFPHFGGTVQLLIFSGTSLLSLLLLRSKIMKVLEKGERARPELFAGREARTVTELLKNGPPGRVFFEGTEWNARPSEGSPDLVPADTLVYVKKIEGATLEVGLEK